MRRHRGSILSSSGRRAANPGANNPVEVEVEVEATKGADADAAGRTGSVATRGADDAA